MLYEYILTAYKVIVGLITTKRLIYIALIAFAFYLLWICFALLFSFQRKFSTNCIKLYNYIRKNQIDRNNLQFIDYRAEKISSGFYHGWKKFKNSPGKNPSDVITRREALDIEVNGGVLNQGKTFMRAFINFVTIILFVLNLAYLGNDSPITCYLIAETMVLPLIFFGVMKLFYFLYTSIRQQMYKTDTQCFYDLITLLDDTFGTNQTFASISSQVNAPVVVDEEPKELKETQEKSKETSDVQETQENASEAENEAVQEEKPADILASYDVFKKKNIDVDKLMEEVPKQANSLPYINVDSDFVIKDEGDKLGKTAHETDTGSSILGGMMQDMSSIKKSNNFIDVDKDVAEIDNSKLNEVKEEVKEEKDADPFSSFEKYAVAENSPSNEKQLDSEKQETKAEEIKPEETKTENTEEKPEENKLEEKSGVQILKPAEEEVSESEKASIANVVSGIKHKSKLANGGVEIQRNEPIARRERAMAPIAPATHDDDYNNDIESIVEESSKFEPTVPIERREVTELNVDDNADNVLSALKSSAGGYDQGMYDNYNQGYNNYGGYSYDQGYSQPMAPVAPVAPVQPVQPIPAFNPYSQGMGVQQNAGYPGYPAGNAYGGYAAAPMQNQTYQDSYAVEEPEEDEEEFDEEPQEVVAPKKEKKVHTKENEPRPRSLRKRSETVEEVKQVTKTRGRPKKAEVSETMTISSDKEFDEVLARAEKLMRKSDEGLSQSQSKRIEKELKMLMDAMNRYKESK